MSVSPNETIPRVRRGQILESVKGYRVAVWRQVWRKETSEDGRKVRRRRIGFRVWSLKYGVPTDGIWHERDIESGKLRLTEDTFDFADGEDEEDGETEGDVPTDEG